MWKLLLVCLFVTSVTTQNCMVNETRSYLLSCERLCNSLDENCVLGTKCVCSRGLFRNGETNLCIEKRYCPLYPMMYVRRLVIMVLGVIISYIFSKVAINLQPESMARSLQMINEVRNMFQMNQMTTRI